MNPDPISPMFSVFAIDYLSAGFFRTLDPLRSGMRSAHTASGVALAGSCSASTTTQPR